MKQDAKKIDEKLLNEMVEKQSEIALSYGELLNRSVSQKIRNTALSILNEEHMLQMEMVDEQSKRGWKRNTMASSNQLEAELHRFGNSGGS